MEEVKYTSEFDGQTTDEVLKHAKSVKDLTIPSLSNISGFVCIDNEGKAIGMMSKEQVAQVVGELIGTANTNKDGLMPSYRAMNILYSEGKPVKITIPTNEGFSLLLTAVKNHESGGQSIINLSGYSKGFIATNIRRGSYISGISYKETSSGTDIYVKLVPYVFFSSLILLTSNGKAYSVSIAESIPVDASEISLS